MYAFTRLHAFQCFYVPLFHFDQVRIYEAENVMNLSTWSVQVLLLLLLLLPLPLLLLLLPPQTSFQADFLSSQHSPAFVPIAITWCPSRVPKNQMIAGAAFALDKTSNL